MGVEIKADLLEITMESQMEQVLHLFHTKIRMKVDFNAANVCNGLHLGAWEKVEGGK